MTRYYDLAAAAERLSELRPMLSGLHDDRDAVAAAQRRIRELAAEVGAEQSSDDHGRAEIEREQRRMTDIVQRMERTVRQIDAWGISLRDISSGLVDFPALASGRPIWLCWKLGEDEIEYWHELDAGIAGRKPLIELE